jgi:anti-anti-sigma factor
MTFEVQDAGADCLVLTCRGEISWEDREGLVTSVEQHLHEAKGTPRVIMDLRDVRYINSAGLGALFQLVQRLRGRGGSLGLAQASTSVQRLFHTVGLDRLATIAPDIATALSLLSESPPPAPETPDTPPD